MRTVLVAYAIRGVRDGRIAEFVSGALTTAGVDAEMIDCGSKAAALIQPVYAAAIVCGSVHTRKFPAPLVRFMKDNSGWLDGIPGAFVTVSPIGARRDHPARHDLEEIAGRFCRETRWTPGTTLHVAGARLSRSGCLRRWIVGHFSGEARAAADISGDGPTDWPELTGFVDAFMESTGLREGGRMRRGSMRNPQGPVRHPETILRLTGSGWPAAARTDP